MGGYGQGVQGTLRGRERRMRHMEVEAGGAQTRVAKQQLDATQVDPSFEEMGGKSVTERISTLLIIRR